MSYKTNAKSLRLGTTHNWHYKAHDNTEKFHIDHKLRRYINNLVDYVVPQAPRNVKTKGRGGRRMPVQPGIQGKTLSYRTGSTFTLLCFYYLNYDGATPKQLDAFEQNIINLRWLIHQETGYIIDIKLVNYFLFFWRYEAFLGLKGTPRRMARKINKCISISDTLQYERCYYSFIRHVVKQLRKPIQRRYRRERYYRRTFYALASSFIFFDFDVDLASKVIALELQILRIYHKKFIYYIRRFFKFAFYYWSKKYKLMQGIQIKIKGRVTNYRRQMRRTNKKFITFGEFKKNYLNQHSGYGAAVAYNRYGAISVHITYQLQPLIAENWEERSPLTPFIILTNKKILENYAIENDFKINPTKLLDNNKIVWNHATTKEELYAKHKKNEFNDINSSTIKQQYETVKESYKQINLTFVNYKRKSLMWKENPHFNTKYLLLKQFFILREFRDELKTDPWKEKNIFEKYMFTNYSKNAKNDFNKNSYNIKKIENNVHIKN